MPFDVHVSYLDAASLTYRQTDPVIDGRSPNLADRHFHGGQAPLQIGHAVIPHVTDPDRPLLERAVTGADRVSRRGRPPSRTLSCPARRGACPRVIALR